MKGKVKKVTKVNKASKAKFTPKEALFIDKYFETNFNATQAAKEAGYSEKTARSIGSENLTKPDIKAEIEKRLKELHLDADGTKAIISKIAKGNANKYLKVVLVPRPTTVQRHLSEFINDLKKEIAFESQYAALAGLSEGEYAVHLASQTRRERKILRYELELKENPDATRDYPGEPEMIEETQFDLVALAKDKEHGIIKSFKMTKDGPQVEFCSIDGQLTNISRVHGLLTDKTEVEVKGAIKTESLSDEVIKALIDASR